MADVTKLKTKESESTPKLWKIEILTTEPNTIINRLDRLEPLHTHIYYEVH